MLAWAGLVLLLAGCRADVVVDIDVDHRGAGEVTVDVVFDEEVMRWAPDLGDLLVTDGLVGWEVRQQTELTAGGERLRVTASKPFADPAELASALAEIDRPPNEGANEGALGGAGLFRGATLTAERDEAMVLYELEVTVGLDRPVAEFVNPATADALVGETFGMPIAQIEEQAGAPLDELVTLVVQATVPDGAGRLPENGALKPNQGGVQTLRVSGQWLDAEIAAADAEAARLADRADRGMRIAMLWWGVIAVVAVFLVVLLARRRRRRAVS